MNNMDRIFTKDIAEFSKNYFAYIFNILNSLDLAEIDQFSKTLLDARSKGATIFFIGNGGSAATASHFANDIGIGVSGYGKPFKAISLTDNVSILTAIGNDFGYNETFVQQLKILASPGDVLVGISASGNSENIIKAFEYAGSIGMNTVAITAFDGGLLKSISDKGIHVPTNVNEYGPAEDVHMILDHLLGAYLMRFIRKCK